MSKVSQKILDLKSTFIDTRIINAKEININGEKIISKIKHPLDTREVITENDLWGSWAEIKDGEVIFHDDEVVNPNKDDYEPWNDNITKVEDNKAYVNDTLYANIQTEKIKDGYGMFAYCVNLRTFISDLSSLIDGSSMFRECHGFHTIECNNLKSLISAPGMFRACPISSFNYDLSSLNDGGGMFQNCSNLTAFINDLNYLTNGSYMFYNCSKLTSFTSDLSSLTNGNYMFYNCSKLTTFTSDLSSLTDGIDMFYKTKLTPQSVMYIAASLPQRTSNASITIGIDVTNDSSTLAEQLQTFAENANFDSWQDLKQFFLNKMWAATWQFGGTSSSITLSEDEQFRGVPVYARLIEVTPEGEDYTEEEKNRAEYCTEDGTKYYNIEWGHDVSDYSQFEYFGSLLEACGYFGVIPKSMVTEI